VDHTCTADVWLMWISTCGGIGRVQAFGIKSHAQRTFVEWALGDLSERGNASRLGIDD